MRVQGVHGGVYTEGYTRAGSSLSSASVSVRSGQVSGRSVRSSLVKAWFKACFVQMSLFALLHFSQLFLSFSALNLEFGHFLTRNPEKTLFSRLLFSSVDS